MNDTNTPEELCPELYFQNGASSMQSHHTLKNFLLRQHQESCTPHSMVVSYSAEHPPCLGHRHSCPVLVVPSSPIGQPQVCPGAVLPPELPLWDQPGNTGPLWGHPSQGNLQAISPKSQISTVPAPELRGSCRLHMDLAFLMALVTGRPFIRKLGTTLQCFECCLCNGSIVCSHQADMKIQAMELLSRRALSEEEEEAKASQCCWRFAWGMWRTCGALANSSMQNEQEEDVLARIPL